MQSIATNWELYVLAVWGLHIVVLFVYLTSEQLHLSGHSFLNEALTNLGIDWVLGRYARYVLLPTGYILACPLLIGIKWHERLNKTKQKKKERDFYKEFNDIIMSCSYINVGLIALIESNMEEMFKVAHICKHLKDNEHMINQARKKVRPFLMHNYKLLPWEMKSSIQRYLDLKMPQQIEQYLIHRYEEIEGWCWLNELDYEQRELTYGEEVALRHIENALTMPRLSEVKQAVKWIKRVDYEIEFNPSKVCKLCSTCVKHKGGYACVGKHDMTNDECEYWKSDEPQSLMGSCWVTGFPAR